MSFLPSKGGIYDNLGGEYSSFCLRLLLLEVGLLLRAVNAHLLVRCKFTIQAVQYKFLHGGTNEANHHLVRTVENPNLFSGAVHL